MGATSGKDIARRGFLVGSAAIAGGVAFGTYALNQPIDNPLKQGLQPGEASMNAWVKISAQDGITIITPHVDQGQGAVSAQAMLVAEEMDLEMGQFQTSFGLPSAAYWNTSFARDAVPFLSRDMGPLAQSGRASTAQLLKALGAQLTGSSTSMSDSFDKLRMAGAVARETLKLAASRRLNVPVRTLGTQAGAVVLADGSQIPYAELAEEAAGLEPVQVKQLRESSQWRLIGKPQQRLDMLAKSTGRQNYGIDVVQEGMLHAAVRTNPRRFAGVTRFDDTAARAMRGVLDVVPVTHGMAVVADNSWRAFKAAEAIEIEWDQADYPAEQAEHWQRLEDSFTPRHLDFTWTNQGDVEAAFAQAPSADGAQVIEAEYRAPYVAHAPLEPLNATVQVNDDGSATAWAGHQLPRFAQQKIGQVLGISAEKVTFHNQYMGGSFGHRFEFEVLTQAAQIAANFPGRPVKLTFSREEDFLHDLPRQPSMAQLRGTVQAGKITSYDLDIASPSAMESQVGRIGFPYPIPDVQLAQGAWSQPYGRIDNFRVRTYRTPSMAPISSWRSVGAATSGFFADCAFDELAHAAGLDPMQARIDACEHAPYRRVLEAVRELSGWDEAPMGPGRGRGVAFVECFGVPVAEVVEVSSIGGGIKIDKVYVACDVGPVIDPVNFEGQVKGGVVWGLGHAMNCEITYSDAMAQQTNFHQHAGMRLYQCPDVEVRAVDNGSAVHGIGEPPVPPAAPALANAIFAATGLRLREMPFHHHVSFV